MDAYTTINISFDFLALLLSIAGSICLVFFPHVEKREKKYFLLFLAMLGVSALFNGLFTVYSYKSGASSKAIIAASRFIAILAGCWFIAFFNRYLMNLIGRAEKGYRIWNILVFALQGVMTVLLIGNLWGGYFYRVGINGDYSRGIVYFLIPVIESSLWIVNAVLVFLNKERLCRQDTLTFYIYCSLFLVALALQCFIPQLAFVDAITVMSIVVLVFSEQSKTTDKLLKERVATEEARLEAAQAKERLLRSQVSPHFIYNALTAIQALPGNPDVTKKAIGDFARYLRQSLSTLSENTLIPFKQELENVQIYLRLEKIRFGDNLKVEYAINETEFDIPAMCVQILTENAVKHGITVRREGGTIRIETKREGSDIVISVEDNGVGFDVTQQMDSSHIGIDNVRNRLKTMVGGELQIISEPGKGTVATIRFSLF